MPILNLNQILMTVEYQKWCNNFSDLPENIIEQLANSRSRNQFIAQVYADNHKKFG